MKEEINQIKNIAVCVKREMALFESELKNTIFQEKNFLVDRLYSFMFSGSKRLRAVFVFLFSKILNVSDEKKVREIALLCEILHNASLLHDDVLDEDFLRRENKTFNAELNSKLSILEGDLLLALALKILSNCKSNIIEIFSTKVLKTIQGEIKQQENSFKVPELDEYLLKTYEKTGNLFMAGLESLFELSSSDEFLKENLKNYLYNFCLMFQIKNDINDFKKNCSDYKNGNYTLPLILYQKECGTFEKIPENIQKYLSLAVEYVKKINKKSLLYLDKIEDNEYKTALANLNNLICGEYAV